MKFVIYSKTCEKRPLSKQQKIGFRDQLSLNAGAFCNTFDLNLGHMLLNTSYVEICLMLCIQFILCMDYPFMK